MNQTQVKSLALRKRVDKKCRLSFVLYDKIEIDYERMPYDNRKTAKSESKLN